MSWEAVPNSCWNLLFFQDILLLRMFSAALGTHPTCLSLCLKAIAKIFIFSSLKRTHQVLKSFLCVCKISSENRPDMRHLYNAVVLQAGFRRGFKKTLVPPAIPPSMPYWKHYGTDITPDTHCGFAAVSVPFSIKPCTYSPSGSPLKQYLNSLWKVTKEHNLQYLV